MTKKERREYNRIWYLKNQEKCNLRRKEYYMEHKEEVLVKQDKYRIANREELRKRGREYYSKNKKKHKEYNVKYKYGLSMEEYSEILKNQDGKCPICGCFLDGKECTHIDHCHETNMVRGILCRQCNLLLGHAKDNLDILKNAIKYLTRRTV